MGSTVDRKPSITLLKAKDEFKVYLEENSPESHEHEIFVVILSFCRGSKVRAIDEVWSRIHPKVDGILHRDVRMAVKLWKEYKLEELDVSDDTCWGGPPLVNGKYRNQSQHILALI